MRAPARVVALLAVAIGASCGKPPAAGPGHGQGPAQVSRRTVDDRPPLELVERRGDPRPAMAFALAHDLGSAASVTAAAVLELRLRARGYGELRSRPHGLGLTVEVLPASVEQARAFIGDVRAALSTPLSAREAGAAEMDAGLRTLRAHSWLGPADAAVGACSGELGINASAELPDPKSEAGRARINQWLTRVFALQSSAFAAVGPGPWLSQAAEGLEASPAWPHGQAPNDPWPAGDSLAVDFVPDGPRRLSLALRVADGGAALVAAERLGRRSTPFGQRLAALTGPLRVERAVATLRPRGACLRVDVALPRTDPGPDGELVANALLIAREESEIALAAAAGQASPDGVTRAVDPRDAAAVAAWRALSTLEAPGKQRAAVAYVAHQAERESLKLSSALAAQKRRWARSTVALKSRDEAGQGELWMLVGSECGTEGETAPEAGRRALFVRALTREAATINEVDFEPWVSVDGYGLLAHAGRRDKRESPEALARRVGGALGRALLTITPSGATVAAARSALLDELGGETRAGYWLAVDTLSPGRPSALEPRGTFAALVEGGRGSVDVERRTLLSEPLRVAVLSNGGARQAALARAALERWIKALRADIVPCAEPVPQQARSGEFTLETPSSGEPEGAYVAVALPALGSGARAAVEATLFLLNRPGGWLEQALSNLPARAQAGFLGGAQTAGLVIRVASTADGEEQAVRQVRGLLVRLARGSATAEDLVLARRALAQTELEGRLDPRRRLVELWRGSESVQELELGTLRAFHGRFEGATQAAVNVRARP